jgi:hypothetical protein
VFPLHSLNDVLELIITLFPSSIDPVITEPFPVDDIFVNVLVLIVKLDPEIIFKSEGSI